MTQSPLETRFWSKVNRNGPTPTHRPELGPCWIWTAHVDKDGYGIIWDNIKKKNTRANRVSWELTNGQIPEGLIILHACDRPSCVNPSHISVGTYKENTRDAIVKRNGWWVHNKGEKHGNAKLTESQAIEILSLARTSGRTHDSIAQQFGVARTVVTRILSGARWPHLKDRTAPPATGDAAPSM